MAKNKRKVLLINPNFQLKFLRNLVYLNVLVCTAFYCAQLYFFWQSRELGRGIALPPDHVFFQFIDEQQRSMTWMSIGTISFVSMLICGFGLLYSHRIAGPIYRLQTYLKGRSEGVEKGPLKFRDADYFPELAEAVNNFIESDLEKKHKTKHKKAA
ncbi:MAG: hypothetical protein R3A80_10340 [Bdellovibrionota bacterium]